MKMPTMGSRDRRALLLGLAVLVPSLGFIWGVRPYRQALADAHDRIAVERDALSRERAAVLEATRSPARKRTADSAMLAARGRVFDGPNDVAAGAAVATYLGEVARRNHVWLASATTRNTVAARGGVAPLAAPDGLRPLRVELRAETDFQGLLEFLDALERGEKLVTVERIDVAKTLRAGEEERETLAVTATVVAYALTGDARRVAADSGRTP